MQRSIASLTTVALLGATGCAAIERAAARDDVLVVPDQVYVAGSEDPKHRLDLYIPRHRSHFPVVVFIHGGYWEVGDRNYFAAFTGLYGNIGITLAKEGIGTAVISYRLSPDVTIEGELEDAARAVRFTLDEAHDLGGSTSTFFLAGHSAGGHMAALLGVEGSALRAAGVDPKRIAGIIAMSPVLDVADMKAKNDAAFDARVTLPVFGADPARLARFSPVTYLRADIPPLLLITGGNDYPFLVAQVAIAEAKLRELHAPVEAARFPGYSHADMVLRFGRTGDGVGFRVAEFVNRIARQEARSMDPWMYGR